MSRKPLSSMTIHGVGAFSMLMLLVAGYAMIVQPLLGASARTESARDLMTSTQERLASLVETRADLLERVEQAQARVEQSGVELARPDQRNARLRDLSALAAETGLRIDSIEPGELAHGDMYSVAPITIAGEGGYADVARFLHEVIARFPDIRANAFQLNASGSDRERRAVFLFELSWFASPDGFAG